MSDQDGSGSQSGRTRFRKVAGLEDATVFDGYLRAHRRRLVDRLGLFLIVFGLAFIVIPFIWGDAGKLKAGDWVAAGSVLVAAGGLFLTLGGEDR
jgi:hypothetical protein